MRKLLAVLAVCAAALLPAASLAAPALAASAVPAGCQPFFDFNWRFYGPGPNPFVDIDMLTNSCGNNTQSWVDCTYTGSHGAHITFRQYGNQVVTGTTTRFCTNPLYGYGAPDYALHGGFRYDWGGVWYYDQLV